MIRRASKKGFEAQLTLYFLVGILLLAIVSSAVISFITYERERDAYIKHGEQVADTLIEQSKINYSGTVEELLSYTVKSVLQLYGVEKVVAFDPNYRQFFSIKNAKDLPVINGWQGRIGLKSEYVRETDEGFYYIVPIVSDDAKTVMAYVMVILDKSTLFNYVWKIFFTNLGVVIVLALVLWLSLGVVIRRLTGPLERFSATMNRAASGVEDIRTNYDNFTELSQMSEAFNQMMVVIEERKEHLEISRDKALQVAKIKSDFAANVSHEIRTPLNGILGMVNLLKEMGLPKHQHEYLEVASKSGDALLQMINDVLDFSKVESGQYELDMSKIDLNPFLEQIALLYAERVQVKGLELCLDLPVGATNLVKGDATRIRQIIGNLLNNAIKFTQTGHITISTKLLSSVANNAMVEISVTDTGIGIPEQAINRIFQPFGQVSAEISNDYGGTGLGLTIVDQMVELMGGTISVTSVVGEGSCFKIVLPMTLVDKPVDEPSENDGLLDGKRVLLIEPFMETAKYLQEIFQHWNIECVVVGGYTEAIAMLNLDIPNNNAPDICLFNADYAEGELGEFLAVCENHQGSSPLHVVPMLRFGSKFSPPLGVKVDFDATIDRPIRFDKLKHTLIDLLLDKKQIVQAVQEEVETTPAIKRLQNLTVLVVDDNATNLMVAAAMLKELGVIADCVKDGQQALDSFVKEQQDLILMDCNMPVMNGYEATEAIRALGDTVKQPVIIALTAKDKESELEQCITVGMDGYLLKPFQLAGLLEKLQDNLSADKFSQQLDATNHKVAANSNEDNGAIAESIFSTLVVCTGDGIQNIVKSYLVDTPIYMVTLIAAMEAGDVASCLDLAHKLKGSSRNLGAVGIVSICREIEAEWSKDVVERAAVSSFSERLQIEFPRVESYLNSQMDKMLPEQNNEIKRSKEVILVVDDDQSTRMTVCSVLEREGYQVEHGVNGREAIKLFEMLRPNVVIMDAMMPIIDGFEACKQIKKTEAGKDVPILITTALESEKSVELAYQSGAADFIPKPINLSVLRQRVRRLLEKQNADNHVQKLAYKDGLTGLPNRTAFVERFQQELEHSQRNNANLAVFFIDIDRFKNINDSLGHEAGDILLKAMAGRLSSCIRSGDVIARLGGDEFVVLLSNVEDSSTAEKIAESMLLALKEPFNITNNEIVVGISIGISMCPYDGVSKDDLLKHADTAMYKAKASGRNTYRFYTQEMSEVLEERMLIESDLRKVIGSDELSLYFQPKQDTITGQVIGSEALIRWQHTIRGLISPAEFVPIAEEMGIIKEIGLWVLETACKTIKQWQDDFAYQGTVAVNVSAVQMADEDFVADVQRCLDKFQLEPCYLELEVTETVVLENIEAMLEKLHQIKRMGVSLSIDDFGTGYSSFSYIKQLPAETLKLDMEFIKDIPENKADMAVVDGMIVLAHNLGMKVVAEGVETQQQYDFLAEHKCDLVQGYLIDKPLPEDIFVQKYVMPSDEQSVRAVNLVAK
ncbi:MAG: response regulator receiver protein [Piscirickettsiaceae bacterium]|nr:MAG: response regulator receiver protein [Piscirickettsiaceae bacterium]